MPRGNNPRRRRVAPAPVDAASGATPAPVRASTAHQDVAAAGAKSPRPRWPEICDHLWKVLGCGLGRRHRSSGGVVESLRQNNRRGDDPGNGGDALNPSNGGRSNRPQNLGRDVGVLNPPNSGRPNRPRNLGHGGDVLGPETRPQSQTEHPPDSGRLEVNGVTVSDEELREYVIYCQDSLKYSQQVICHMCVFDKHKYHGNHFWPTEMLKHCGKYHGKVGLGCNYSGCRIRVSTEEERILHTEFCHRFASRWWDNEEYRSRLEMLYKLHPY